MPLQLHDEGEYNLTADAVSTAVAESPTGVSATDAVSPLSPRTMALRDSDLLLSTSSTDDVDVDAEVDGEVDLDGDGTCYHPCVPFACLAMQ